MSYLVNLPVFEGPMDLLLHLIDTNEIDIYNIPIAEITRQYMEYIRKAEEMDLELTSEFAVMACTLLAIKARMLLPKQPRAEEEEPFGLDPRDELIQKLIEYRLYKEKSLELKEMEVKQARVYYREPDEARWLKVFPPANPIGDLTPEMLAELFAGLLNELNNRDPVIEYMRDEITIAERMTLIMEVLSVRTDGVSFFTFIEAPLNKEKLAATFWAVLELMRQGFIMVRQKRLFGDILLFPMATEEGNAHEYLVSQ